MLDKIQKSHSYSGSFKKYAKIKKKHEQSHNKITRKPDTRNRPYFHQDILIPQVQCIGSIKIQVIKQIVNPNLEQTFESLLNRLSKISTISRSLDNELGV